MLLGLLSSLSPAFAQAGWKTEVVGKTVVMTPTDLAAGDVYQITIFPRVPMKGALITDFLDDYARREDTALGKPAAAQPPATAKSHIVATAAHLFKAALGQPQVAVYFALAADAQNARVVRIFCSRAALLAQYQAQENAVIREMRRQEDAAAKTDGRGVKTEALPPTPQGMTPGGKLVPGIYIGNAVRSDNGEIATRFRLYLYASGECQVCNEKGEEYRFGPDTFTYDPITGKLDISQTMDIYNSVLGWKDAFSLYGRDAGGKPYLYARSDRGFEYVTATLRYAGPPDKPSPKQLEAQKAAAEAEAKRYKYVTAPGKGIPDSQIAGVLIHVAMEFSGTAANAVAQPYLLLRDGTIHDGLPVAPDEMDAALSRRREPEKWGRWRRQGGKIAAAWPDAPNKFSVLTGDMAVPGRAGERLLGRFGTGSTSGSTVFGGSYRLWGVTFTPDGRFVKDNRGGSSSGSLGTTMNDFSVNSTYDDDGSVTSFSSPGAVGYAKNKKRGSSRAGTYAVSGYTLTLRYDNGKTARLPFFFEDAKRDQVYFEGALLAHDDGK